MNTRAIMSILAFLAAGVAPMPSLAAPASRAIARHPGNCLASTVVSCPRDLRAVPVAGLALQGYVDRPSGLFIKVLRTFVGRVTWDEGCYGPPQYQLYLRVMLRNTRQRPVTFDLVGLTVEDQTHSLYNPFGWGGTAPGHAQRQEAKRTRTVWLPYYLGPKPTSLTLWWSYVYAGHSTSPTQIARYRVRPTGMKVCQL